MDETMDYHKKLRKDMLAQFEGKPKLEVLRKALASQLSDVYEFFYQLRLTRSLQTAVGAQLDGIGSIVCLSRLEALALSQMDDLDVVMDDDLYRKYLYFKIHLNTNDCTHTDVYKALKMFWNKPLYYHEELEHPATIFFESSILSPEDDVRSLFMAPKVKAAGVALYILAITETPMKEPFKLRIKGTALSGIMTTKLPPYPTPEPNYETSVRVGGNFATVENTPLPVYPEPEIALSTELNVGGDYISVEQTTIPPYPEEENGG